MRIFSRRKFIRNSSLAVGMAGAVASVPGLPAALGSVEPAAASGEEVGAGTLAEPLVARVRDLATGEVDIFSGTSHVTTRDPQLAARILKAFR
ncbi:MAG TPA: hypothetical protein VKY15_06500 [Acidimicrobiales bacterium]|nr:hypothetical protein [Acidimicrobiales bacterium]